MLFSSRRRVAALRAALAGRDPDADVLRALGEALAKSGDLGEAIRVLTEANRLRPDDVAERRMIRLRRKAFTRPGRGSAPVAWGAGPAETGDGTPPLPLPAAALTPETLRAGIRRHGCVWVRGLVPPPRVEHLRDAIDRAFAAADATDAGRAGVDTRVWYDELERVPKDASRSWVRAGKGVLAADSPRAFFAFLEMIYALGIDELIAGYLGERPALSVEKTVLRRADASLHESTWHQDGAFLGDGIRTVDAWFALSPCGRDAPGLDLLPVRLERVLPPGEEGTYFGWTVSPATIARHLPGVPVWRPEFEAGDALFFDHFLVHRTAADPRMTGTRYAIESWFFAPSVYPRTSTPLVV
jgi:hypothetical protein